MNKFKRTFLVVAGLTTLLFGIVEQAEAQNKNVTGVIYVTSQGLYYDTFVTANPLPPNGPFQKLEFGPNGAYTEFGPGAAGYLGGRWWVDVDANGVMDASDVYLLCPLVGPGRTSP